MFKVVVIGIGVCIALVVMAVFLVKPIVFLFGIGVEAPRIPYLSNGNWIRNYVAVGITLLLLIAGLAYRMVR